MSDKAYSQYRPFDREKAIEAIKFVAKNAPKPDIYWIGKIMYFADLIHLQKYGRLICGDAYVAMKHGTVPSGVYDLLKDARQFAEQPEFHPAIGEFEIQNKNTVVPLREADMSFFSKSDIACLTQAIEKYGKLTFNELHKQSADSAYKSAEENDFIDLEQIIAMLPNSKAVLDYIRDTSPV